jgi:hypothetical protein
MREFLQSARQCLSRDGTIYLTLTQTQGVTKYEAASNPAWNLEEIALDLDYDIIDALPFDIGDFPGYAPTYSFEGNSSTFQFSTTHVLKPKTAPLTDAATMRAYIAPLFLTAECSIVVPQWHVPHWTDAVESLLPYCAKYKSARSLYEAATSFGTSLALLENVTNENLRLTTPSSYFIASLYQVYRSI